jgi:hypothetical protein
MSWGSYIGGAVYVAKTVGYPFAKIGLTVCDADAAEQAVAVRLKKLGKNCPLPLKLVMYAYVEDAPGIEADLLRRFSKVRVVGEWVRVRSPLVVVRELGRLVEAWVP